MYLVDTSVWIEVLKTKARYRLDSLIDFEEVVTCLPVVQELLQGIRSESAFQLARESMDSLPMVESPLSGDVFDEAVDLYRSARRRGATIRSGTACLIAACALRHQLTVLHHDRDFDQIATISPLESRRV